MSTLPDDVETYGAAWEKMMMRVPKVAIIGMLREAGKQREAATEARDTLAVVAEHLADNLERYHILGERDRTLLREARAVLKALKGGAP